jgi:hypothetical protein
MTVPLLRGPVSADELEGLMAKSARSSIESIADALSDTKDEVWDRAFEIAMPAKAKKAKRAGRAKKGGGLLAGLGLLGGLGFVLVKKREEATSAAKTVAGKSSAVAKSAAEKGTSAAKSATGTIKAKTGRGSDTPTGNDVG